MAEMKYQWDGEKIKRTVVEEEKKFSTKDILDSLNHVRGQIEQIDGQLKQNEQQKTMLNNNLKSAREFEAKMKQFEEKCTELQVVKLKLYVNQLKKELSEKARKDADDTVAKDLNAYAPGDADRMAYLNYQKLLATNGKVAENISAVIIKKYLYETPVFDNPFKG